MSEAVRTLREVFSEPLAVEALFATVALVLLFLLVRGLKGVAERISRRRALKDFVAGVDLFFKGEFEAARDELVKVLERDPENSEARILLGDAYRALGDLSEAHKHHFQVAQVFGQDVPRNRLSLGRDLFEMGKYEEAIPHLARAYEADLEDRETGEMLLEARLETGRFADAVAQARRMAESAPEAERERAHRRHASVCALAGRERMQAGEVKEGGHLLRTALRLNPALVGPRLELVRSAYVHGTTRAAEKELVAHLKEMQRLAEDGDVVFEPPAALGAGDGRERGEEEARPALPSAGERPKALPHAAVALPAPPDADSAEPGPAVESEVPAVRAPAPIRGGDIPEAALPVQAGTLVKRLLPREAVYLCAACGHGEVAFSAVCPACGEFGALVAADEGALVPVESMREVFDEIQENRAFIRTLVRRAAGGDVAAGRRLLEAGARAVPGIFRELMRVADNAPLVRVLSGMGPAAADAIVAGYRRAKTFSTKRLVREGVRAFRSPDTLMVKALAGMGEAVLPKLTELFEGGDRDLRVIALDVLIRLGRADVIEELRFALPTKDLLERLNACPEEELPAFLDACPAEGFLTEQVLTDRTFRAEKALVRAIRRPGNRAKLRLVLMERGFSSVAYEALEEIWDGEETRQVVTDVIRSYGRSASDHLLRTYTTPKLPEAVKEGALRLFLDLGDEELERLLERFSEGDAETERAVMRIIQAFGSRAVPALLRVYGKTGFRERIGLNRRRLLYRKTTLVRALGHIGTYDAIQGLRRLHEREGDGDLKRRIRNIIERLVERGGGR